MCSIGDDVFDEVETAKYMPQKEKLSPLDKCNKCREETPCVVLRSKDKYCKACFLAGTTHKFKAMIGKHKLIRPHDRVMIIHRCGHPTTALLHFVRAGIDLESHKKLRFDPLVIFIEDNSYLSVKARRDLVNGVEKEVGFFKFPTYYTSLTRLITASSMEDALQAKPELLELREDDKFVIDKFLSKQSNETNKNDFLNIIRRQFRIKIAKYLECKFIFSPEISNDVASQLLTDISLGRGPHVPLDTGFCDSRDEVKILRPLRLFDAKELAFYNHLNGLEPVSVKVPKEAPYKSIQNLMKRFVNDLQMNYPATVTTILKTGDKLSVDDKLTKTCDFCNAPISGGREDLTSAESTRFSHWVSTQALDYNLTSQERYSNIVESFENLNCGNYCFSCKKLK